MTRQYTKSPVQVEREAARLGAIRDCAGQGWTVQQTADYLGVAYSTVWHAACDAGITFPRKPRQKVNVERNAEIVALRNSGMFLEEIAARFDMTRERVRQICERNGAKSADEIDREHKRGKYARVAWTCEVCQRTEMLSPSSARTRKAKRHKQCDILARGEIIAKRRIAGERWTAIGRDLHGYERMPEKAYIEAARRYLKHCNAPPDIWRKVFPGKGGGIDEIARLRMSAAQHHRNGRSVMHPGDLGLVR